MITKCFAKDFLMVNTMKENWRINSVAVTVEKDKSFSLYIHTQTRTHKTEQSKLPHANVINYSYHCYSHNYDDKANHLKRAPIFTKF